MKDSHSSIVARAFATVVLIGVLILVALRLRGNEEWLQKAGEIVGERRETPEELAHRSAI